jgi:ABC-type lipoprotein release transport system permease subunit
MLAVGYFSVVVMWGWAEGLVAEMIGNGTEILTGQLQVHSTEYRPDKSVYETIGGTSGTDVTALVELVSADPAVAAATPRVYGGGLVSSGAATSAAVFLGVDPQRELEVSRIMHALERGRQPDPGANEVLIGAEMARTLGAEPGDEVVVVAPAIDGSMGNDLFVVAGVFSSGVVDLDRTFALFPIGPLQRLMVIPPNRVHEVAARVASPWQAPEAAERIDALLDDQGLNVVAESWTTLRPEMVEYAQLTESFQWILLAIVFGMAIFGVANTMLLATFERRNEFAVLLALGTKPSGIVRSVFIEALGLGAIGMAVGAIVTLPVLVWWHNAPPDMSWLFGGFTMQGALIRPVLRVEYSWSMAVYAAVALFATVSLASVYPAFRAARVPPADTMAGR